MQNSVKTWLAAVTFVLVVVAIFVGGLLVYQGTSDESIEQPRDPVRQQQQRDAARRSRNAAIKNAQSAKSSTTP